MLRLLLLPLLFIFGTLVSFGEEKSTEKWYDELCKVYAKNTTYFATYEIEEGEKRIKVQIGRDLKMKSAFMSIEEEGQAPRGFAAARNKDGFVELDMFSPDPSSNVYISTQIIDDFFGTIRNLAGAFGTEIPSRPNLDIQLTFSTLSDDRNLGLSAFSQNTEELPETPWLRREHLENVQSVEHKNDLVLFTLKNGDSLTINNINGLLISAQSKHKGAQVKTQLVEILSEKELVHSRLHYKRGKATPIAASKMVDIDSIVIQLCQSIVEEISKSSNWEKVLQEKETEESFTEFCKHVIKQNAPHIPQTLEKYAIKLLQHNIQDQRNVLGIKESEPLPPEHLESVKSRSINTLYNKLLSEDGIHEIFIKLSSKYYAHKEGESDSITKVKKELRSMLSSNMLKACAELSIENAFSKLEDE